tara:strand:- start:160 stop:372 length:213 start_codon:yes stop_codon:yes gene_type:complete
MSNETIKINLLENGEFNLRETSSKTVGDLRNELEIPASANVMVSGTIRQNDFELTDNAVVAYASNNKVGG